LIDGLIYKVKDQKNGKPFLKYSSTNPTENTKDLEDLDYVLAEVTG